MKRLAILVLSAAIFVTGCSRSDPNVYDYEEYDADYLATAQTLTLPADVAWPAHATKPSSTDGKDVNFERGSGISNAQFFWMCVWAKEYLKDPAGARGQKATEELAKVTAMRLWEKGVDEELRVEITQAMNEAKLGASTTWQKLFGTEQCTA